ncbi:hypothetical protein HNQ80_000835 [Anaerosolibacter carboniphilus]|uniref:Copper amine oxidase-like N-terminal domain-containing protein n=1 Tax=Anaerosolibacter carboniphilus TaxID=1417629 RepID=A0A841KV05_9FIRM|nr:copper amine oxidase N-terminal domain-containing protein [Anaerosolibacter carboniphilus]MBB6214752.1 hypothetical protein [Anaerosolibacter carboniphilus]
MKKFISGLIVGIMAASMTFVFADQSVIKLIVNGKEIQSDVPPQIINGRTLVPARPLAEALNAKVEWDEKYRAVIVTSVSESTPKDLPSVSIENNKDNLILGRDLTDKYGVKISAIPGPLTKLVRLTYGDKTIETDDYQIIEGKTYFNKNILTELGIQ